MDRWDGGDWSEEEWFSSATQQYGEDQGHPGGLVEEDETQQLEDTGMVEFCMDESIDEWIASYSGVGSQACGEEGMHSKEVETGDDDVNVEPSMEDGRSGDESIDEWIASYSGVGSQACSEVGMNAKEVEVRDENVEPSTGGDDELNQAGSLHSEDTGHLVATTPEAGGTSSEVVVGDHGGAQTSQDPSIDTGESMGPTADHTGGTTDDRPVSEIKEMRITTGMDEDPVFAGIASPSSRSHGMAGMVQVVRDEVDYATRPPVGVNNVKPESADGPLDIPAENVIARFRGRGRRDGLRDSNPISGSQEDRGVLVPEDANAMVDVGGGEGHEPLVDVLGVPLPGEVHTAPPGGMSTSPASTQSQPASQLRMSSKANTVQYNNIVTPGVTTGATRGGGEGGRVGPGVFSRKECVHTRDGTCHTHGPGARWRWKPIPPAQRTVGPDGKIKKRLYFWSCEVGPGGKNLRQAKMMFKKKEEDDDDESGGNNAGTRDIRSRG